MQTLQEIKEQEKTVIINDENTGDVYTWNSKTGERKPVFLEEQIRDIIPIDREEEDETV